MSGLPPNRSPEAIPTRIENYTASDGSAVEIVDYYQFVMLVAVSLVLFVVTMMSAAIPANRAASIQPADALRTD